MMANVIRGYTYEMIEEVFLKLVGEMESSQFPLSASWYTRSISMCRCIVRHALMILIYQNNISLHYCYAGSV